MLNPLKSTYYTVNTLTKEIVGDDDESQQTLDVLTSFVKTFLPDIKDGDVIGLDSQQESYRNTANFFWDAKEQKVIPMGEDLDEYGCAPPHFTYPRFPLHFFESVLTHNNFVRLEKRFVEQIRRHAKYGQVPVELQALCTIPIPESCWSFFMHGNDKHYVLGIPSDANYRENEVIAEHGDQGETYTSGNAEAIKVGTIEYITNFMRLFMDNVCNERICFTSNETNYGCISSDVLFVEC
jgi:hypothetical protein